MILPNRYHASVLHKILGVLLNYVENIESFLLFIIIDDGMYFLLMGYCRSSRCDGFTLIKYLTVGSSRLVQMEQLAISLICCQSPTKAINVQ